MNPFDYVKDVSYTKKDIMTGTENDELAEKDYNPFLTNHAFSYHADSVLHANEMNRLYNLSNRAQFYYYINILRKRNRFSKWNKKKKDDNIELVCNAYNCSRTIAKQYLTILSKDQLKVLKKKQEKGGI